MLMGASLLDSRIRGRRFPFMVNWAITGKCNLKCTHCYGEYGRVQNEEVPLDTIKKTIDALRAMGTKRITIEGGEPLVRKDAEEIISYIYDRGIEMSLCTNGVLLERHAGFIKDKIDLLVLSLEGCEEHHDALRGAGNFSKVLNAIEVAKKHNMRALIFTCLIDENINDIDFLIATAQKYAVNIAFNIGVAKVEKEGGRGQLNKVADDDYKAAFLKISNYKRNGAPVFYSESNFKQVLNWPTFAKEKFSPEDISCMDEGLKKTMIPCYAGVNYCYVECDGSVYPCYQTVGIIQAKNIAINGFKESFEHLSNISSCKHCYNTALSELNLQCKLDLRSVLKVIANYRSTLSGGGSH